MRGVGLKKYQITLLVCITLLLIGCSQEPPKILNKLVANGESSVSLEISEYKPYTLSVINQKGNTENNTPFSKLRVRLEDTKGIVSQGETTIDKDTLTGGEQTKAKLNIVGEKAGETTAIIYVDSEQGSSQPVAVSVVVSKPSLYISFGSWSGCLKKGQKESREVIITNNDRKPHLGRIRVTSNYPDWINVEPSEGYSAENSGGVFESNVNLNINTNTIPFYITATPNADSAGFKLIFSIFYSKDGKNYKEVYTDSKEMSAKSSCLL